MNQFKRILSICLAATFVLTAFASCANKDDQNKRPVNTGGVQTDAAGNVLFEEADYNGAEFKTLHYGKNATDYTDNYIWSEAFTGEAIGDAVKERNQLVEDKYNVVVTAEEVGSPSKEAQTRIQAGQVDFNLIYEWGIRTKGLAMDGMLYDFHELNYVNFDQTYWIPSAIEGLTIADRMFVATNMITMNALSWAQIYYFNKMIMDELQLTYPYDYVDQNNWTYDVVLEMVTKAEYDVNGDGMMGVEDRHGGVSGEAIMQGVCSNPMYEVVDGEYRVVTHTEGMVAAFNAYESLCDAVEYIGWEKYTEGADTSGFPSGYVAGRFLSFGEDHQLFLPGSIDMTKEFVDMKNDYGIVPVPVKKAGDAFSTTVDYNAPMFSIPMSVADPDMTGMILEYMAYESERLLLPAYYDTTIKTKRMQDTRDYTMLDIIRGSITYDWTGIYMWDAEKLQAMRPAMLASGNFASVAAKYGKAAQAEMDEVLATLESIA